MMTALFPSTCLSSCPHSYVNNVMLRNQDPKPTDMRKSQRSTINHVWVVKREILTSTLRQHWMPRHRSLMTQVTGWGSAGNVNAEHSSVIDSNIKCMLNMLRGFWSFLKRFGTLVPNVNMYKLTNPLFYRLQTDWKQNLLKLYSYQRTW